MDEHNLSFLKRLLDAPGPSGYEQAPAKVWREEAGTFADEVWGDVLGNSFARLKSEGAPRIVIEGHIDEIGFLITHIDEQGYIWFDGIGGWDDSVVVGQRMRIAGRDGDVRGVVGRKAAHLIRRDEKKDIELRDLWIDIGAADRADARRRVDVGDPIVVDADFIHLTDDCPFAPGAPGNLSTEALIDYLHGAGYVTGVDVRNVRSASAKIKRLLTSASRVEETVG